MTLQYPLVNAWGFGYGNHNRTVAPNIDTIMPFIGYRKITLKKHKLIKENDKIRLDASAIAKGQASDEIAKLLEGLGSRHYLVEIGGEIRCRGVNAKGEKWHIGIDKPIDDPANEYKELETVIAISNVGLATSGNYRQFYFKNGKKYTHTIDPNTGTPVEHNLLSASVVAPTCMQADAYATAFMVLGVDESIKICESLPDMECYLIFADKEGKHKIAKTKGFDKYLVK
ncbi:MAG: FAD:protein FMN transferase [Paludibacteraceae bacterium]